MHDTHLTLVGGTESLTKALADFQAAWKAFIVVHRLDVLSSTARPTTIGWKVADKASLFANLAMLGAKLEQVHIGTVNGRFIASGMLAEPYETYWIVKILERRNGSEDPLGLDSIDFLVEDTAATQQLLQAAGARVVRQHNEMHEWLSVKFGKNFEYEAKFSDSLVLAVSIKELQHAMQRILGA